MNCKPYILGAFVVSALAFGHPASATVLYSNATGAFNGADGDESVFTTTFTLSGLGNVQIDTLGYAGGTNANGVVVAAGGFNSDLALFSGTGNSATLIASNDGATGGNPLTVPVSKFGACNGPLPIDPATGLVGDSCLNLFLGAGTYTVALTEYDNDAIGPTFGDGFFESVNDPSDPDSTAFLGCTNGQFCDAGQNNRTDAFALDVTVPEPGTLPVFGAALLALGLMRRRWNA